MAHLRRSRMFGPGRSSRTRQSSDQTPGLRTFYCVQPTLGSANGPRAELPLDGRQREFTV